MKCTIVLSVVFGFLGRVLVLGQTLPARSGPAMDDERMTQMMKMMGEMGRMRTMMEQHRGQMMKQCSGAEAPAAPSK